MNGLIFDDSKYVVEEVTVGEKTIKFRKFSDIVYVANPVDTAHQSMNIYVPEAYYEGAEINGYNKDTAPVFFPNTVGGYMQSEPDYPGRQMMGEGPSAAFTAIEKGYVVAAPGTRGRGTKDAQGNNIGIAPAVIVDLKSAVRYLRYNNDRIPGNMEKIISNGTSAGGASSSLLGCTGNHPDYEPYLREAGAADERDDVFASSCYCPITNLDNADMAYEWEFAGQNSYIDMERIGDNEPPEFRMNHIEMDAAELAASESLRKDFPVYVNSLNLRDEDGNLLTMNPDGSGSFRDYVMNCVAASAQKYLDNGGEIPEFDWLHRENGAVTGIDFKGYTLYKGRMKKAPAFDSLNIISTGMGAAENELFASATEDFRHFTKYSFEHSKSGASAAEAERIKLMNPMNYINDPRACVAKNIRLRHGTVDHHTSLAISVILYLTLREAGINADLHHPWDVPHSGDYDLDELFAWIEGICRQPEE